MSKVALILTKGTEWYHKNLGEKTLINIQAETFIGDWMLLDKLKKNTHLGRSTTTFVEWKFHRDAAPIIPISVIDTKRGGPGGKQIRAYLSQTQGSYEIVLKDKEGEQFSVLYFLFEFGVKGDLRAYALVPTGKLTPWYHFVSKISEARSPKLKPKKYKAYVIGSSTQNEFKPRYSLDDVILPDGLKEEIVHSVDWFFTEDGLNAYKKNHVAPFRKILLHGVPGTGKSMCAEGLAADSIAKGRLVVYVAASDRYGASFSKIQSGLEICKAAKYPVLMIVEELEAYVTDPSSLAQIRNVLEGFEMVDNVYGSMLLMTSNQPHLLDDALLRFGRIDQRFLIPPVNDAKVADQLLRMYLGDLYPEAGLKRVPQALVSLPPVFIRELCFSSRMFAASANLSLEDALLENIKRLKEQSTNAEAFEKEARMAKSRSRKQFSGLIPEEEFPL